MAARSVLGNGQHIVVTAEGEYLVPSTWRNPTMHQHDGDWIQTCQTKDVKRCERTDPFGARGAGGACSGGEGSSSSACHQEAPRRARRSREVWSLQVSQRVTKRFSEGAAKRRRSTLRSTPRAN